MTHIGFNPLVGIDNGNPPPGSHNHNRALPPWQADDDNQESNFEQEVEYVNPPKYCILHVFLSATMGELPPAGSLLDFKKLGVPTSTTMGELIEIINCRIDGTNINTIYELIEKGGGRWSTGMKFHEDDVDRMSKKLEYFGWDDSRDGNNNPQIWLRVAREES